MARYEAEQARQAAIAAAAVQNQPSPSDSPPWSSGVEANASPLPAPAPPAPTAFNPPISAPAPAPSANNFDQRVEQLYRSYVDQGQGSWDAWNQACMASGGYVVDQGPDAGCQR
ncbi:MAG: hypothetical protein HC824_01815 [Synechococcales cyanobacterium RM1_1_8]|nr:hypothetical protein [Synechococcales cyanobacterium RM1_1_8]